MMYMLKDAFLKEIPWNCDCRYINLYSSYKKKHNLNYVFSITGYLDILVYNRNVDVFRLRVSYKVVTTFRMFNKKTHIIFGKKETMAVMLFACYMSNAQKIYVTMRIWCVVMN